jgi:hypothetical protein
MNTSDNKWTVQYCDACSRWTWHKDVEKSWNRECGTCHKRRDKLAGGPGWSNDSRYYLTIPEQFMIDGIKSICRLLGLRDEDYTILRWSYAPDKSQYPEATRKHGCFGLYVPGRLFFRVKELLVEAQLIEQHTSKRFAGREDIRVVSLRHLDKHLAYFQKPKPNDTPLAAHGERVN